MAVDTRKARVEEQLKIKIGEAKNLIGRNGNNCGASSSASKENRDVYCTVALDQEEICRTPTIERTLSPFFGEVYQFEIPRRFRYLSVYVWDRDRHLKQDKPYGKIAIKREDLHQYNHKDHWFPLRPVDEDSEVQGMAHLEITVDDGVGNLKQTQEFDDYNHFHVNHSTNNSSSSFGSVLSSNSSSDTKENSASPEHLHHFIQQVVQNSVNSTKLRLASESRGFDGVIGGFNGGVGFQRQNICGSSDFGNNVQQQPFRNILESNRSSRISIKLTECMDLARKNGLCDPYAILTAHYSNKKKISKRTKGRKKTVNPEFGETVSFDLCVDACGSDSKSDSNNTYTVVPLGGADLCEVTITFWHDSPGMGDDVFLGEIKLPVRGKQQLNAVQQSAWYYLQPRTSHSRPSRTCATPPGTRLSCDNSLGSLRLKLDYSADHVFPLATYDQLLNILIQSIDQKPITSSAVHILGEIIQNKTEVAQPLVRLFTYTNLIAPMIKSLADHEISKLTDPTTIFRGNTLVSKMMDEAMRLSGLHYLHNTLRPIVAAIFSEKKPCEIDPARVKDKSMIDTNLINLQDYVEKVFEAITKSAVKCPAVLCQIFHDLRECAAKYFPQNKEVRYSVVSGFIFLRFFAPAILGPKLFDLTTEPVDEQTTRTLTLISKTIQSLGNLVSSRSAQQPCKEQYTGQLYKKFCTEKHVDAIKHFLEVISTVGANITDCESTVLEPVVLKEGMMTKRAQGRKRFGRRNFKQRYFRLTTQSLSYAKAKGKRPLCDIPLSEILAVERLTERSFKMQNIFQIVRKDRPLYVQTANCVEEKEWVDLLSKICQSNKARLEHFHPCAYINGMWTCCNESDQYASGCQAVSPKPFQMEQATVLDPARDLQRLHSLIIVNFGSLEELDPALTAACEDPAASRRTIKQLNEIANSLERIHRKYKTTLAREMRYGSRQAPIGDDNYLHTSRLMVAGGNLAVTVAAAAASYLPQHFERSPNPFHRNHQLRSSDNERFSQC
ncbi:GTPase-activating protein [Topomyia yanbarensis]|uniref:GTPase-activating protein n=1 Tax=Topomyia yanbarensis TaxID=2498891 RepID=UPI00273CB322|nr:GTPase-activating protein [Topomyia yanbarensis]XP_058823592.1 GTPase-activating protein [Topomyia yanbarensis]XP_058823593.1 GTPase-activating protein [Topomyia yanbarensis]XP_058823594.1 GTPase-activating protein [Topomyia yanbarensis]XP_058823595.1 GTPase-activating protein [Topomyia yanbarensis]